MKVYKWMHRIKGGLRSLVVGKEDGPFFREYVPGQWTEAPAEYPQAWLFAFKTIQEATDFVYSPRPGEELWECETRHTRHVDASASPGRRYMAQFWEDYSRNPKSYWDKRIGYVLCDGIQPLRRIK